MDVILEDMKQGRIFGAGLALLISGCMCGGAQEKGNWQAANGPAQAITGDVALSAAKLAINFSSFTIARIRDIEPGEVSSVFDADSNAAIGGVLYRLSIPAEKKFLHHNSLCGAEETQWMVTYVADGQLHLAFFSGPKIPVFTPDAIANTTDLCGTFSYVR